MQCFPAEMGALKTGETENESKVVSLRLILAKVAKNT